MDKQNNSTVTNEELRAAFTGEIAPRPTQDKKQKTARSMNNRRWGILNVVGGVSFAIGLVCLLIALLGFKIQSSNFDFPTIPSRLNEGTEYSVLTGEPVANPELLKAPTYCVQMPNGTDGARPQAGLTDAGVVFEAIAESGITRFAAIYQNPTTAIIGPVRSLRIYYLQWDTPFDCTIVHAGGSGDALAAVGNGYRNLDENYSYMYRGTYGGRLWNNLFTTSTSLRQFNADNGYNSSDVKGFARLTPAESEQQRINESVTEKLNITKSTKEDTSAIAVPVPTIALNLGGWADFNVKYDYDVGANTYLRSYESGDQHQVYSCGEENLGEKNPEEVCNLVQVAPSVVIAMMVQESRASDNYHEDITAIGSGDAYVFQNGTVAKGKWQKSSTEDQIEFTNENGEKIKLAPGQTFVTAVPNYGSVTY